MSSFNRRLFCIAAVGTLAGCGFAPVYGPSGGGARLQNAVKVDTPKTREDFLLTRTLEERLGRPASERYGLSYSIALGEEAIAISANDVTSRYNLLGEITYALRDLDSGQVVTSGKVSNFTGYSASGSTVATQAAERDARARLMTILADEIATRLLAASSSLPE